jgi:hypothetical protein
LPDFSWFKHTKMWKIYQMTTKLYQAAIYVLCQIAIKCSKWS